ncbi:hypothetical protein SAMN05216243_1811 [Sediminibacillus albus]|uniref:Uncharacterized protein n=1 Tax=Sediminibacillus albus TaxID=407036 RepID=A0A1G8YVC9_9BACI|nr:hypothetical protein SAMN05216243_1811 [Sediminibacillus albus]
MPKHRTLLEGRNRVVTVARRLYETIEKKNRTSSNAKDFESSFDFCFGRYTFVATPSAEKLKNYRERMLFSLLRL